MWASAHINLIKCQGSAWMKFLRIWCGEEVFEDLARAGSLSRWFGSHPLALAGELACLSSEQRGELDFCITHLQAAGPLRNSEEGS